MKITAALGSVLPAYPLIDSENIFPLSSTYYYTLYECRSIGFKCQIVSCSKCLINQLGKKKKLDLAGGGGDCFFASRPYVRRCTKNFQCDNFPTLRNLLSRIFTKPFFFFFGTSWMEAITFIFLNSFLILHTRRYNFKRYYFLQQHTFVITINLLHEKYIF